MDGKRILDVRDVRTFVLAGKATFTLKSTKTGTRFTYKIRKPEEQRGSVAYFVQVLTGADNMSDYQYLGIIRSEVGGLRYERGKRSKIGADAPSHKAFAWAFVQLINFETIPNGLEVWHEGKCGRCGRKLTVPESIDRGIGPDCASQMGLIAEAA